MAVAYTTLAPYPQVKWNNGAFQGETVMKCAWSSRAQLLLDLDGTAWPYNDAPPDALPYKAEIRPWGKQTAASGTTTNYNWALVKVIWMAGHYSPRIINNFRVTETFEPTQEYLAIDTETADLWWENGDKVEKLDPLVRYELQYTLTFHNVLSVPSSIYDRVHYCNNNAIASYTLNKTFLPETLLYIPPSIKWTFTLGRVATYEITYRFHFRPMGWNKFWNAKANEFMAIGRSGSAIKIYPLANF